MGLPIFRPEKIRPMKPIFLALFLFCICSLHAQEAILINDVVIFNGTDETTIRGNVLIEGNEIRQVSTGPIAIDFSDRTQVIEGGGRFLMPGLIDAHVHLCFEAIPQLVAVRSDLAYVILKAADASEKLLLQGFTTVRDLGGNTFGLKKAIDQGLVNGPRVYPCGAAISQTGGHGDYGMPTDVPRSIGAPLSYLERNNMFIIADGVDQVLLRVREQLRNGASQIKLMAGGGVSSDYDPLDVTQYTEEELRVAVSAAENWGTYVTVHAYTPRAVQQSIRAGVKCIEHGQMLDEETVRLMVDKGTWWSMQVFVDEFANPKFGEQRLKQLEMQAGTDQAYRLAKKLGARLAWGSDVLFDPKLANRRGEMLAYMTKWFTPFEVLKMATADNGELMTLSGPRNPYSKKLGVIEEGAYADLVLVNGNPLENINLLADPARHFQLIVKDGKIYKNTLK